MKIQLQTQKVSSNINRTNSNNQSTPNYLINKENKADSVSFGATSDSRRIKASLMAIIAALGITAGAATTAKAASTTQKTDVTGSEIILDETEYTVVKRDENRRILKELDEKTGNAKYYTYFDSFYTIQYVRPDNTRYLLEMYDSKTKQLIANDRCNHPSQWEKPYTGPTYNDEPKAPVIFPDNADMDWSSVQFYLNIQEQSDKIDIEDYSIVDSNTLRVVSKDSKNPKEEARFITVDENNQIINEESYDEYFNRVLNLDDETAAWGSYKFIKNIEYNRIEAGFNPGDEIYTVEDEHTIKAVTSGVEPDLAEENARYYVVDDEGEVLYTY